MAKRDGSGVIHHGRDGQEVELTRRQFEVLELAAHGLGYKHIAAHLGISRRTVEDRFREMRERTGAGTTSELVAWAVAADVVQLEPRISRAERSGDSDGTGERSSPSPRRGAPASVRNDPAVGTPSRRRATSSERRRKNASDVRESGEDSFQCPLRAMTTIPRRNCPTASNVTAPHSAKPDGALVGYACASSMGQPLVRQIAALQAAGCQRVFSDKYCVKTAERPELGACLDQLRPGDTLVVASLGRLSRSLGELITVIAELHRRSVGFKSLHEPLDTTTLDGQVVFQVFTALAEYIPESL